MSGNERDGLRERLEAELERIANREDRIEVDATLLLDCLALLTHAQEPVGAPDLILTQEEFKRLRDRPVESMEAGVYVALYASPVASAPEALEVLDEAMNWALANRGTEHEFVICRSRAPRAAWMDRADELLRATPTEEQDDG